MEDTNEVMFLNINDASKRLGLARSFIRAGCISGKIPHIKCGSKYMICVPQLVEQLAAEAGGERE